MKHVASKKRKSGIFFASLLIVLVSGTFPSYLHAQNVDEIEIEELVVEENDPKIDDAAYEIYDGEDEDEYDEELEETIEIPVQELSWRARLAQRLIGIKNAIIKHRLFYTGSAVAAVVLALFLLRRTMSLEYFFKSK